MKNIGMTLALALILTSLTACGGGGGDGGIDTGNSGGTGGLGKKETFVTLTLPSGKVQAGDNVVLKARLTDDSGNRVVGRTVWITAGGSAKSGLTDQSGEFSASYTVAWGRNHVRAEFDGDASYVSSLATGEYTAGDIDPGSVLSPGQTGIYMSLETSRIEGTDYPGQGLPPTPWVRTTEASFVWIAETGKVEKLSDQGQTFRSADGRLFVDELPGAPRIENYYGGQHPLVATSNAFVSGGYMFFVSGSFKKYITSKIGDEKYGGDFCRSTIGQNNAVLVYPNGKQAMAFLAQHSGDFFGANGRLYSYHSDDWVLNIPDENGNAQLVEVPVIVFDEHNIDTLAQERRIIALRRDKYDRVKIAADGDSIYLLGQKGNKLEVNRIDANKEWESKLVFWMNMPTDKDMGEPMLAGFDVTGDRIAVRAWATGMIFLDLGANQFRAFNVGKPILSYAIFKQR